jgi:ammonia channel protein AmtB
MYILFSVMKKMGILRVSREHELAGLDLSEHGETEGESY